MVLSLYLEFVADAPYRGNGPVGVILDFFPQTLDMYVHGAGVADVLVAPDVIQKLLAGKYLVGRCRQEIEQFQLLGGHFHGVAAVDHGVVGQVYDQIRVLHVLALLLGGGHVSLPVAEIGKLLGFHVTVMDDREDFVTQERFPQVDERITGDFETLSEKIPPYENAWYVVVTRGHLGDSACARQILKRPFAYFGMIGSKTKVRITREKLLEEGFTEEQVNSIHAPIGLPIGGQMPAEIAVSIMAEIVQEKNRHFRTYCDEDVEAAVRCGVSGTMVTIIEKKGSSPRGTGSKMFVFRDGRTAGSIGGGKVEFEAGKHAVNVHTTETRVYELGQGVGDLGMICGGTVKVLFEPVNV